MKVPISKDATITGMKSNFRSHLVKWGLVFGLTLLYAFGAFFLMPIFGPVITAFSIFPIAAVSWYFGMVWGIVASLAAIGFNLLLAVNTGDFPGAPIRNIFYWEASCLHLPASAWGCSKKNMMNISIPTHNSTHVKISSRY
ncbi:MAG: hypothetical protein IPL71_22440 [Anaerolineales bacterium]|uniref:hypothetical protein n=1 Tax=Candidatus Villigracilis proximus TaxID=3140683 RepID=UPI0031364EDD|nr:hypothetical protein [Anaerolineales bacterium]